MKLAIIQRDMTCTVIGLHDPSNALWHVSYIKERVQAKSIQEEYPDANIWVQEGCEWAVEKA